MSLQIVLRGLIEEGLKRSNAPELVAVSTPARPAWRWRIMNYAGEIIEESHETFPSIAAAVRVGARRLREIDVPDRSSPAPSFYRSTSHLRRR